MRLLLATNNPGKIAQIRETLHDLPCEIVSSSELGLGIIDVEESGSTLEENARLKARGFFHAAQTAELKDIAVLADDGGLQIDTLNGEPGIYARRWAGEDATDEEIIAYALKGMEGIPLDKRTARFSVYQVLILPDGQEHAVTGTTEGAIVENAVKNKYPGLPYGALLLVSRFGKVYDELNPDEQVHTHRAVALNQIRAIILQNIARYA
ncbi:MAG: non-canonical purine NTP pyrophosphatase [Patescibacteria group bacterium]|jgi:XTP/dITP diphosphohydrolase